MGSWEHIGTCSQAVFTILQAVITRILRAFNENENRRVKQEKWHPQMLYEKSHRKFHLKRHLIFLCTPEIRCNLQNCANSCLKTSKTCLQAVAWGVPGIFYLSSGMNMCLHKLCFTNQLVHGNLHFSHFFAEMRCHL